METTATYDFDGTAENELSFKKGAILKILNACDDKHWYKAESDGREGSIPSNYVRFTKPEWYHGQITRGEASELLSNPQKPNGAFLVRESESTPGDFQLSVRNGDKVEHLKILRDGGGRYFLWMVKFNSLNQMVDYHRTSSVLRGEQLMLIHVDKLPIHSMKALYDFEAQSSDELGFKKDDIIQVTEKVVDSQWWKGELNGKTGLFPVNYVKELI